MYFIYNPFYRQVVSIGNSHQGGANRAGTTTPAPSQDLKEEVEHLKLENKKLTQLQYAKSVRYFINKTH